MLRFVDSVQKVVRTKKKPKQANSAASKSRQSGKKIKPSVTENDRPERMSQQLWDHH